MAKYVIINQKNEDKIMKAFGTAQGRATARTVDGYKDLTRIIEGIEKRLYPMTKKAMNGIVVHYDFRQGFPNAYRYSPESTHFDLIFDKGTWRVDIESICRGNCPVGSRSGYMYHMRLSDTAKAAILERYE